MTMWRAHGTSSGYGERRFPNDKLGHVLACPQPKPAVTKPKFDYWLALLDGNIVGKADDSFEAQCMVEAAYKERYE